MLNSFCPRLSEARHFLPLLRSRLVAGAAAFPLPVGLALDLLPIVEDGLFGYELVPDRDTHTYLTVGCNARGDMVLRKTLYGVGAPSALQLVAVNGHLLSRSERAAQYRLQQRDTCFADLDAAAGATWARWRQGSSGCRSSGGEIRITGGAFPSRMEHWQTEDCGRKLAEQPCQNS